MSGDTPPVGRLVGRQEDVAWLGAAIDGMVSSGGSVLLSGDVPAAFWTLSISSWRAGPGPSS